MGRTEEQWIAIFEECNALRHGHFVYTSGRHGRTYVNKDLVIAHPQHLCLMCGQIAEHFRGQGIDVVAAPAIAGVALTQWTAFHLSGGGKEVLAAYADKDDKKLVFRRQYDTLIRGKKVLAVEDIVTTGGSLEKLIATIRQEGGEVVGAALLWNRGNVQFDVPTLSLVSKTFQSFAPAGCPLCKDGIPFNEDVGHGHERSGMAL